MTIKEQILITYEQSFQKALESEYPIDNAWDVVRTMVSNAIDQTKSAALSKSFNTSEAIGKIR